MCHLIGHEHLIVLCDIYMGELQVGILGRFLTGAVEDVEKLLCTGRLAPVRPGIGRSVSVRWEDPWRIRRARHICR